MVMAKDVQSAAAKGPYETTGLDGMKEICAYFGNRSETTILRLIREEGFPADKLGGNVWMSDKIAIDDWRRERVRQAVQQAA
jgi:predicted DNA-binding transcriptional regulator AlpA